MKNLLVKWMLVQKSMKAVAKNEENDHFNSKFFDINALIRELRTSLNDAGLVVMQPIVTRDDGTWIVTVVADPESGEEVRNDIRLPPTADVQKMGAAITYLRRYALTSLFLVEGEKDTDGNDTAKTAKDYSLDIELAEDMASLKAAWDAIPKDIQKTLGSKKDAAKARIERKEVERKELETIIV